MLRRPRRNHRAPTIMGLSNFRNFQFSAPIFGHGATPAPGVWNFETPKKVDPPGSPDYPTTNSKSKLPKYISSKNLVPKKLVTEILVKKY